MLQALPLSCCSGSAGFPAGGDISLGAGAGCVMGTVPAIRRRRRPPLHWKLAVSVRKRWHRLRRLWRPDREIEDCRYFGAQFRVAPDDLIGREMLLQRFEWLQIPAMLRACRELMPAAFIDIGANFGLYTCIVGRQELAERLIAFEPNGAVVGRLREHLALNGIVGVEIHQTAVGARRHKAALSIGAPGFDALSSVVSAHPGGHEIDVVALDEMLEFFGRPLVIKIDVEGYELEVLAGAERLLGRNYGYAQIESFEELRAAAVIDRMAQFGWRLADHVVDDLIFRRDRA
jgi:FkbM family methyltransferase